MNTNLGALRERLFNFRAWDSSGVTLNKRIREAINVALERLAGDVPEALVPDEQHVVLLPDVVGTDTTVAARLRVIADTRVLEFTTTAGAVLGAAPVWSPTVDGTWDGIMHLEVKDPAGTWHRRQSREWWTAGAGGGTTYYVTLDRPGQNATYTLMEVRIHQPEFFLSDDVMQVLEPARIYEESRQQVWKIDTAGAYRQDMVDFQGNSSGRPYRLWRGRHFQMPTPRAAPEAMLGLDDKEAWAGPEQTGKFKFCYTIVWGRRDAEWQYSPGGTQDPMWESAPSPATAQISNVQVTDSKSISKTSSFSAAQSIWLRAENIDFMTAFDIAGTTRESHSGFRIRFYVARDYFEPGGGGPNNIVESSGIYYLLAEVEPTVSATGTFMTTTYLWNGSKIPDFYRPLKHSTGYFAWKVYPHQDNRYELDFRVLRLPRKLQDDQDTAPIQRDAIPALIELSLHYMSLIDGVDQQSAQIHLDRFQELARRFRARYANPGKAVAPTPLGGYYARYQYGTYRNTN